MTQLEEKRLLDELVAIDTCVPPGRNYERALKVVGDYLEGAGFQVEYVKTPEEVVREVFGDKLPKDAGERVNLVARVGQGGRTLLLNAHIDTVPPGPGWTRNPFELFEEGGKLYGRGTSDDKGGVVALACAAKRFASKVVNGSLVFTATCDEEVGGRTGLGYLVQKGLRCDDALVADGSIRVAGIAANGCMRFSVKVIGKAAHASRNWLGINAIEKASVVVQALTELNKKLSSRLSSVPADPESGVKFLRPSLTVAMIQGGVKENVVPPECTIIVDRRLIPEENFDDAKLEIQTVLEELRKKDAQLKYQLDFEPQNHFSFKIPEDSEIVKLYVKSWEDIGSTPIIAGGLGCVDSCYLAKEHIPVVTCGVSRAGNSVHGADEFVYKEDLEKFSKAVEKLMTLYFA
ncbi:hypothetical protein B9Q01_03000 [Candidatus Marsarchaeota G1 archaeon OSP_D]|nr:MAG: hypothetical protein B9Q01_03000 [Candidatus Marsarchaeota G1 archaeon OSP_D]PSN88641.1 MAG: hypothetical protein B9Q00_04640 [Candidatus Marsarchaeota G1 archaeon OSP_C]